jgi:hypothetical protein
MSDISAVSRNSTRRDALLKFAGLTLASCGAHPDPPASIEFTRIPQTDQGGRDKHDIIEGRAIGAAPGQQIVLYAKSGNWWVQPLVSRPFTKIQTNAGWTNATHLGTEYAAVLVKPGFQPSPTLAALPAPGGAIVAVASVKGARTAPSATIQFSGYEWRVRDAPSSRGGKTHKYDPNNVWVDSDKAMHLRIRKTGNEWTCAETSLERSLGYGTYSFTIRDISALEPAAVFGMFTWDYARPDLNFGEVDIEISRRGRPSGMNAQFTIQPHYVRENVFPFTAPAGVLTHSFQWAHRRMSFKTVRVASPGASGSTVAEHVFTSGIPSPAIESVRMCLYVYGFPGIPLENGAEVVIEKFEYLP